MHCLATSVFSTHTHTHAQREREAEREREREREFYSVGGLVDLVRSRCDKYEIETPFDRQTDRRSHMSV